LQALRFYPVGVKSPNPGSPLTPDKSNTWLYGGAL